VDAPMPLAEFKGAALWQEGEEKGPGVGEPKHVNPLPWNYFLPTPLHCTNDNSVFHNEKEVTHACCQISQSDCKSFSGCYGCTEIRGGTLECRRYSLHEIGKLFFRHKQVVVQAAFLTVIHEANYCKHPARRAAWSTAFKIQRLCLWRRRYFSK